MLNGLAHWIKGGAFVWVGIFTLGRWAGAFGDIGWVCHRLLKSLTPQMQDL